MNELFEFIEAEKDTFDDSGEKRYTVQKMCVWLGVSKSGFYEWCSRPESVTTQRRAYLGTLIRVIFEASDQTYGHRRVHALLRRQLQGRGEDCRGVSDVLCT